jgi:tRNA dimethylallyltransferase
MARHHSNETMKYDTVVLTGPTAVGKTELSLALAETLGAEIVSLDSRLVYRGLDIGTAKPAAAERARVPHHLIDIADPGDRFTVSDYMEHAGRAAADIRARGRLPLFTGGTCMYLTAMLRGYALGGLDCDAGVRAALERRIGTEGAAALHAELAAADPESAARIHPNNARRVIRALEVLAVTGCSMSERNRKTPNTPADFLGRTAVFGLARQRNYLKERINERTEIMYNNGLMDETRRVLESQRDAGVFLAGVIGYAEAARCAAGEITEPRARELTKRNTRAFAKRQLTWFRGMRGVVWLNLDRLNTDRALALIRSALYY